MGNPWWLSDKESACNAGDMGLIPGLARSPGEGNGNPTHSSILGLGNPSDRGAWWAMVHAVAKSWTRLKQLMTCMQVPPAVDVLLLFLEKEESISSWPRDRTFLFSIVRQILYHWATWEAIINMSIQEKCHVCYSRTECILVRMCSSLIHLQRVFHGDYQLLNIYPATIIQRSHDTSHRPMPFQRDYIEFKSFIKKSFILKQHLHWHCQCRVKYSSCFYSGFH